MTAERPAKARWQSIVETASLLAIALAVGWQAVHGNTAAAPPPTARQARPEPPVPTEPLSLDGAQLLGAKGAPVALIAFSDFQCPFCGKCERETLPELRKRYVEAGRVLFAFRQLPLAIHPFAEKAAEAANCAGREGKFWQLHDQLFAHQQELDEASVLKFAQSVGVNDKEFSACLSSGATGEVKQDGALAKTLQIMGTPTFFVGTVMSGGKVKALRRLSGAQPLAQFERILDEAIATSQPAGKL
jgi:protein-disulfide isomerase